MNSKGISINPRHIVQKFRVNTDYKVDEFVLQHFLRVDMGKEETDVVSLDHRVSTIQKHKSTRNKRRRRTLIGFLRRIKKDSARWFRNRVNLCTKMDSISSACLILML